MIENFILKSGPILIRMFSWGISDVFVRQLGWAGNLCLSVSACCLFAAGNERTHAGKRTFHNCVLSCYYGLIKHSKQRSRLESTSDLPDCRDTYASTSYLLSM